MNTRLYDLANLFAHTVSTHEFGFNIIEDKQIISKLKTISSMIDDELDKMYI